MFKVQGGILDGKETAYRRDFSYVDPQLPYIIWHYKRERVNVTGPRREFSETQFVFVLDRWETNKEYLGALGIEGTSAMETLDSVVEMAQERRKNAV